MLDVKDLYVSTNGNQILKGISFSVKAGEIHAFMGPNGSGKSTLAKALTGYPGYSVDKGTVAYEINKKPRNLFDLKPHERAREGMFLAFQYPVEIPGVTNSTFLRAAYNEVCKQQGVPELDPMEFDSYLQKQMKVVKIEQSFIDRAVNVDFSGGEKKKNEILQMAVLKPRLSILDETDSGLDIDALKIVSEGINSLRSPDRAVILITHYCRILNYIVPDYVHILYDGRIIRTGGRELAAEIEEKGFDWLINGASKE